MSYTKDLLNRLSKRVGLACLVALPLTGVCLSQTVTLSVSSGPPTTQILVSGTGFKKDAAIDIYFDTTADALALANASGAFSGIAIEVPASAVPGTHWVSAVQISTETGAQAAFTVGANWSEFGYTAKNDRFNSYENVLNTGNVADLDVLWTYDTGGDVESSPAVVNGVVYIASNDNYVYALNATTGALLWKYNTGAPTVSSPAVANGLVYVGYQYGLLALNAETGALVWSQTEVKKKGHAGTPIGYVDSSPAVANGVVYFGSDDGLVYALNAANGSMLWSFNTGSASPISPSPAVFNGEVYINSNNGNVYALNATTGAVLWAYNTGSPWTASPAVSGGQVFIAASASDVHSPCFGSEMCGLEPDGVPGWQYETHDEGTVAYSAALAHKVVYFGDDFGFVYAAQATAEAGGDLLWSSNNYVPTSDSPAVANGVVYIASVDGILDALNAANGDLLWTYATDNNIYSSPAVANGVVYVGSNDKNVYAFALNYGGPAAPERPDLKTLRPDLTLELSQPVAELPNDSE